MVKRKERFIIKKSSVFMIENVEQGYFLDTADTKEKAEVLKKYYEDREGKYITEEK